MPERRRYRLIWGNENAELNIIVGLLQNVCPLLDSTSATTSDRNIHLSAGEEKR